MVVHGRLCARVDRRQQKLVLFLSFLRSLVWLFRATMGPTTHLDRARLVHVVALAT